MRIASWNVNSLRVRLPHLLQWLETARPDIVCLQETKSIDDDFPLEAIKTTGYHAVFAGQKTYNGVAILSREPAGDIVVNLPENNDPQRRVLGATIGGLRVLNLYVPNGQDVASDKYVYKLNWLERLAACVEAELKTHSNLIVLGDFNIAPEDRDVHDPALWAGQVLCSEPERNALRKILNLGLHDSFRLFEQAEGIYSWWDYRAAAFRRNLGLRIDLILVSHTLASVCTASQVDKEPRKWERPSDHAPVIADFNLDA
jgi:exodeoxyribonuclease-3